MLVVKNRHRSIDAISLPGACGCGGNRLEMDHRFSIKAGRGTAGGKRTMNGPGRGRNESSYPGRKDLPVQRTLDKRDTGEQRDADESLGGGALGHLRSLQESCLFVERRSKRVGSKQPLSVQERVPIGV